MSRLVMTCYHCRDSIRGPVKELVKPSRWRRSVLLLVKLHPGCYRARLRAMGARYLLDG